ncbi:uncharacterized protein LOC121244695 [Juglans microcarpa x Juglans regia]|uniref:uncharacterized protein LOC121244695 n=1 Tax=Juglans microcarpa x Juglans regia TaxID=2249226 RepID=UPI001B7E5DB2|nr:uncharacterized protein LOC121244695 [Juglans microcarpa x Juglans regia]
MTSFLEVLYLNSSMLFAFVGGEGDVIVIVIVIAVESTKPGFSAVSNGGGAEEGGDVLFLNRDPHRAVIVAMAAAIPTTRSENESNGCINGFSFKGILLPMTKTSKER